MCRVAGSDLAGNSCPMFGRGPLLLLEFSRVRRLVTPGFRLGRRSHVSFYKRAKGMSQQERSHREVLGVEALEGRALLSGLGVERPHASPAAEVGRAGHPRLSAVNSAALNAILAAMGGGPGHEF